MSDITDIANVRVPLGLVAKWIAAIATVLLAIGGAIVELRDLEKDIGEMEARVHNLEEHVVWQHE